MSDEPMEPDAPEEPEPDPEARLRHGKYIVKGARGGPPAYTQAQRRRVRQGQPVGALTAGQKRKIAGLRAKAGKQAMKMGLAERRALGFTGAKKAAKKQTARTRGGQQRKRGAA